MGQKAVRILVAEANDLLGHAIADVFRETAAGATVHVARTLPDALAYSSFFHCELVVVDAWISHAPVEHLVAQFLAVAPGTVVVVVATLVDADFERRAKAAGAAACIEKEAVIAHAGAIVEMAAVAP